ncbi:uncharacterized protein LOC119666664, partial [Teleopsis dalmanni]|uniref:uncharacterized protein LOC119666664 n=1 Tax=Teleopsis dalmanni TaxID=139649 RepID=UPI0018CD1B4F
LAQNLQKQLQPNQPSQTHPKAKPKPINTIQETQFGKRATSLKRKSKNTEVHTPAKRSSKVPSSMRKSQSLDTENYSLTSIQAPLWATLTNARTINEISQDNY